MPVSVRFIRGKEANQFHPWVTHRLNRLLLGSLWTHPFGNVTFWRNFHEDCMCWMLLSSVLCDSCSSSASLCRRGLVCALSPVPRPLYVCFCSALEFPVFCGLPWMHQNNIRSALDGSVCGYARRKGSFCLGELTMLWTCVCETESESGQTVCHRATLWWESPSDVLLTRCKCTRLYNWCFRVLPSRFCLLIVFRLGRKVPD